MALSFSVFPIGFRISRRLIFSLDHRQPSSPSPSHFQSLARLCWRRRQEVDWRVVDWRVGWQVGHRAVEMQETASMEEEEVEVVVVVVVVGLRRAEVEGRQKRERSGQRSAWQSRCLRH
ncbi:hypothetical protein ES702_00596 [subsurface metagenome]